MTIMLFVLFFGALTAGFVMQKRDSAARRVFFFSGMVVGLGCALLGFVFYLVKSNYYENLVNNLLYVGHGVRLFLLNANISKDFFVTQLNFGSVLFVACVTFYTLSYTNVLFYRLPFLKSRVLYLALALIWGIEFLVLFPPVYVYLSDWPELLGGFYRFIYRFLIPFYRTFHTSSLLAALALLLYDYLLQRKVKRVARPLLYHLLLMLSLVVIYFTMFSWMPQPLMRPSLIQHYFTYLIPDIQYSIRLINVLPLVSFCLLAAIAFFTYKYRQALAGGREFEISFDKNMRVASQSMRIYTHSIKNQLVAIQSEAEYLGELTSAESEAAYCVKLIREACNNALKTVNAGSEMFRQRPLHLRQCPLGVPVDGALRDSAVWRVRITKCYTEPTPAVYLDAAQIQEVLQNLFSNAADAIAASSHPDRGEIAITIHTEGRWRVITVEDNGCGMDKDTCASAIEPFFSTKSSSTNWGMGLSLCQKIMAAHNGTLALESIPNVGTKVDLMFPVF